MVPKWVWKLRALMGGVERGISPQCQGEKNAIHIVTARSRRDRRGEGDFWKSCSCL